MPKNKNITAAVGIQLRSIELLKCSLNLPNSEQVSLNDVDFKIGLEHKADISEHLVFVIVSVEIMGKSGHYELGALAVSCIYKIENFHQHIKLQVDGKLDISSSIAALINDISISTVRGVMFSTFKGTFLHNAFLPIVDTRTLK